MPLPIGHTLMGVAIAESSHWRLSPNIWKNLFIFVLLANLPDLDYLPGYLVGQPNLYHHHELHSLGFAVLMGVVAGAVSWYLQRSFWPHFTLVFSAIGSHLLLDLLTEDFSAPAGMMLVWPVSPAFIDLPWKVFAAVHKSDQSADFFRSLLHVHNLRVVLIELAVMMPVVAAALLLRRHRELVRQTQPAPANKRTGRSASRVVLPPPEVAWRGEEAGSPQQAETMRDFPEVDYSHFNLNQPGYRNGKG